MIIWFAYCHRDRSVNPQIFIEDTMTEIDYANHCEVKYDTVNHWINTYNFSTWDFYKTFLDTIPDSPEAIEEQFFKYFPEVLL